jgi:26S proteasome regulatory subunit N7
VLPSDSKYADVFALITSFHTREYAVFFNSLSDVEQNHLRTNRYLAQHTRWYVREMRRKAYAQILESYRSLSLSNMAKAFGVTPEFLDRDLSQFIPSKQLNCVIDRVKSMTTDISNPY